MSVTPLTLIPPMKMLHFHLEVAWVSLVQWWHPLICSVGVALTYGTWRACSTQKGSQPLSIFYIWVVQWHLQGSAFLLYSWKPRLWGCCLLTQQEALDLGPGGRLTDFCPAVPACGRVSPSPLNLCRGVSLWVVGVSRERPLVVKRDGITFCKIKLHLDRAGTDPQNLRKEQHLLTLK